MVVAEAPAVDEPAVGPARAGPERERTGAYVCTLVVEEFIPDADGPACEGDIKGGWPVGVQATCEVDDTIGKYLANVFDDKANTLFRSATQHFS